MAEDGDDGPFKYLNLNVDIGGSERSPEKLREDSETNHVVAAGISSESAAEGVRTKRSNGPPGRSPTHLRHKYR